MTRYTVNLANLSWRGRAGLVAATAIGLAAVIVFAVLFLGLALVLVPVVAVAFAIVRWRLRRMMDDAARRRPGAGRTIEIDYRVIDGESRERR